MSDNKFTGASLEKALRDDTIVQSGIFLVGMVKSADKEGFIKFTKSGCENWVDLPINIIEQAEKIGHQPCKDHSHPVMRITLRMPKDPEAQILATLLIEPSQMPNDFQGIESLTELPTDDNAYWEPSIMQRSLDDHAWEGNSFEWLPPWGCRWTTCKKCIEYKWINAPYPTGRTKVCWRWLTYPCKKCPGIII